MKQLKADYKNLKIIVKDIILPYLKFNIDPFKAVLELFQDTVLTPETIAGYFTNVNTKTTKNVYQFLYIDSAKRREMYKFAHALYKIWYAFMDVFPLTNVRRGYILGIVG